MCDVVSLLMYLQAATYKSNSYFTSLTLFDLSIFGVEFNCYAQSGTIREHVETNLAHACRFGNVVFNDWHQLCRTLGAQQATTMAAKTKRLQACMLVPVRSQSSTYIICTYTVIYSVNGYASICE